jgi:hypothetical protein
MFSNNTSKDTKSRTDYISGGVRFTAKADSLSETAVISNNLVANKGSNGCIVNIVLPLSVDRTPPSPQRNHVAQQTSELRPNARAAEMTTVCTGRDFRNELDKRVADVTTKGNSKEDGERDPHERFQSLQPNVLGAPQQLGL